MKNIALLLAIAGLFATVGCSSDDVVAPTAPAVSSEDAFESQFPVNHEMPGVETEFAPIGRTAAGDIVDTAIAAGFETLVAAVQAADLVDALRAEGPFTVFAPTDEAFAKLPAELLDALLQPQNQAKLQQILLYHVVEGQVLSRDLRFFQSVPTLEGSKVDVLRFFRLVLVNGVRVQLADVLATNGVIHVIDEVLIPEGFTLDDPAEPTLDLVGTAQSAGLTTLVAAVQAAGLVDALSGSDLLTVFAPTDAAFDALPEGLVAELLQPENVGLLQELLLYHVTAGQVLSTDLNFFQFVPMLNGGTTLVTKGFGGVVRVNLFSKVVAADVLATNGVAHVIDRVLVPRHFYGLLESLPSQPPREYEQLRAQMAEFESVGR